MRLAPPFYCYCHRRRRRLRPALPEGGSVVGGKPPPPPHRIGRLPLKMNIMDFNVKKLAADAGTFLSRAVQVRRHRGDRAVRRKRSRVFPSWRRGRLVVPLREGLGRWPGRCCTGETPPLPPPLPNWHRSQLLWHWGSNRLIRSQIRPSPPPPPFPALPGCLHTRRKQRRG